MSPNDSNNNNNNKEEADEEEKNNPTSNIHSTNSNKLNDNTDDDSTRILTHNNNIRNNRILFGSCNSQHYKNILWDNIISRNASGYIWVGDAVYGDDFYPQSIIDKLFLKKSIVREATPPDLIYQYNQLLYNDTGYSTLIHNNIDDNEQISSSNNNNNNLQQLNPISILAAFDDHDYGVNNGDKLYEHRKESAVAFIDFIRKSNKNHNRREMNFLSIMEQRAQSGKGVYGVKVFDFSREPNNYLLTDEEAGLEPEITIQRQEDKTNQQKLVLSDKSVAIFILDVRTHKDPWPQYGSWYKNFLFSRDYTNDFLGIDQWMWLNETLPQSTASVNILVQGLQVHADRYFDGNAVEDWSRFPLAQHKLYQIILNANISAPVLVSGDVHMAELLRKDCRKGRPTVSTSSINNGDSNNNNNEPRMLLEVTTSGMTHSWGTNICARPHTGLACRIKHVHTALEVGMHVAHNDGGWTDVVDIIPPETIINDGTGSDNSKINNKGRPQVQEGAKTRVQYALERNFGEIEFDWEQKQLVVRILGHEVNGKPLISTRWDFDLLSGKIPPADYYLSNTDYEYKYQSLKPYGVNDDDWFCVNYKHDPSLPLKVYSVLLPISVSACIMMAPVIIPVLLLMLYVNRKRCDFRKLKQA